MKLLKAAGIKPSGTGYVDIEKELIELVTAQFEISSNSALPNLSSLISYLDTGKVSINSDQGEVTRTNYSSRRFSKWKFCIGPVLELLLNQTPLARVNPNILESIGRSPLKLWLYSFYSTHGGDGNLIFKYSIKKLLDVSGIKQSIEWRTKNKGLLESDSDMRSLQNKYFSKALREQVYRLRKAISWLSRLRIFQNIQIEQGKAEELPVSSQNVLVYVSRFISDFEQELWSLPIRARIRYLKQPL